MMKLRLAQPGHLVDLQDLSELRGIDAGSTIVIGAMTTQHALLTSAALAATVPLLRETSLQIADPQVRYCGTLGGNVANGDPGDDMPAAMMALNASYSVKGEAGERDIPARDFYQGAYATSLGKGEILTSIRIPAPADGHGYAYEAARRSRWRRCRGWLSSRAGLRRLGTDSSQTHRWRGMDSNFRFRARGAIDLRIEFATKLIAEKIANSIKTLETVIPASRSQKGAILRLRGEHQRLQARYPDSVPKLLGIEGRAAAAYFRAWEGVPLRWKATGRRPIPESWRTIGPRSAVRHSEAANVRASHPLNAMLNYAYVVLIDHLRLKT